MRIIGFCVNAAVLRRQSSGQYDLPELGRQLTQIGANASKGLSGDFETSVDCLIGWRSPQISQARFPGKVSQVACSIDTVMVMHPDSWSLRERVEIVSPKSRPRQSADAFAHEAIF